MKPPIPDPFAPAPRLPRRYRLPGLRESLRLMWRDRQWFLLIGALALLTGALWARFGPLLPVSFDFAFGVVK